MTLSGDQRIVLERVQQIEASGTPATAAEIAGQLDRQIGQTGFTDLNGEVDVRAALGELERDGLVVPLPPAAESEAWRVSDQGHAALGR